MPLLVELEKSRRTAGDKGFRWKAQNDAAELLSVLISESEKAVGPWSSLSAFPREITTCMSCKEDQITDSNSALIIIKPLKTMDLSMASITVKSVEVPPPEEFNCPNCEIPDSMAREVVFEAAPAVLLIQLNRWTTSVEKPNELRKDVTVVDVSTQNLYLPVWQQWSAGYALKAVICHEGSALSGHYYTYAKHHGKWFFFNDSIVRPLNANSINKYLNTKHGYMYVYEKVG